MADPKVSVTIRAKDRRTKPLRTMRAGLKKLATQGVRLAGRAAQRFGGIPPGPAGAGLARATRAAVRPAAPLY